MNGFDEWWSSDGQYLDPDTSDVPWFDKRRGLAAYAYAAGVASAATEIETLRADRDSWRRVAERLEAEKQTLSARVGELERSAVAVGIKPLEWEQDGDRWHAITTLGSRYTISGADYRGERTVSITMAGAFGEAQGSHVRWIKELSEGFTAAQADYEPRVRAALSPQTEAASPAGEATDEDVIREQAESYAKVDAANRGPRNAEISDDDLCKALRHRASLPETCATDSYVMIEAERRLRRAMIAARPREK